MHAETFPHTRFCIVFSKHGKQLGEKLQIELKLLELELKLSKAAELINSNVILPNRIN